MNSTIEAQIHDCEARLYAAMLASDVAELDVLISNDLLFSGPTGELATKAMDLELHRTGGTVFQELLPQDLEIRLLGEQVRSRRLRFSYGAAIWAMILRGIFAICGFGNREMGAGVLWGEVSVRSFEES